MAFRFFDLVLRRRLKEGRAMADAKADAYDAVELRFGICKKTLQNLMTMHRCSGEVADAEFRFNNETLIVYIKEVNEGLRGMIADNERLLDILEGMNADVH